MMPVWRSKKNFSKSVFSFHQGWAEGSAGETICPTSLTALQTLWSAQSPHGKLDACSALCPSTPAVGGKVEAGQAHSPGRPAFPAGPSKLSWREVKDEKWVWFHRTAMAHVWPITTHTNTLTIDCSIHQLQMSTTTKSSGEWGLNVTVYAGNSSIWEAEAGG